MNSEVGGVEERPVLVQKYGGSSVATPERIKAIAERIVKSLGKSRLVVVLSAMGKATDKLVDLAHQVAKSPTGREMDVLLATGEQVSVSLLGLALQERGVRAISLTAAQCGIRTDDVFNIARIKSIDIARILEELDHGQVVIIPGFQGVNGDNEITTLGRGGSDITGAALAVALEAEACEICTDVDGVLSADPGVVPDAKLWQTLSYASTIEMASSGAKVLHPRAAELCMAYGVPIHVRSSFHERQGTWIVKDEKMEMEQAEVVGVNSDKKIAKITLRDVPDQPGLAAKVFRDLAKAEISVRLIIQSESSDGLGRISFVLDKAYIEKASTFIDKWKKDGITNDATIDLDVAKISIIGSRLASTPGLAARMFTVLAQENINIDCISSSEMKIACVIHSNEIDNAVRAVHAEFFPEVAKPGK